MGMRVLAACDEIWLCGERMSAGMKAEETEAKRLGLPIQRVPSSVILPDLETGEKMDYGETNQRMEDMKLF